MDIGNLMFGATRPYLHRRIVDETFDSEFSADFSLPKHILDARVLSVDEGLIKLIGDAVDAAKLKGQQSAARIGQIAPDAVEQSSGAERDDVMGLAVRVFVDVFPKLLRLRMPMQGHVKIPSKGSVLRDVVEFHEKQISQN